MLIAAYAGCGKSTAAKCLGPDVLDLPSMPYRWLLPSIDPSRRDDPEMERDKGELHHIFDVRFPNNYVLDILEAEQSGKTVLFPTIVPVIDLLAGRYGRDVLVVYPEDSLKEEYRQRFVARGNSKSFLSLFIDEWEERLKAIEASKGRHLRLKSGEYLLPVLQEQRGGWSAAAPIPPSVLAELERKIAERGRSLVLWALFHNGKGFACPVEDLDSPAARETLEAIGKAAFARGYHAPDILPEQLIRDLDFVPVTWCRDLGEFYQAVAAEPFPLPDYRLEELRAAGQLPDYLLEELHAAEARTQKQEETP